MSARPWIKNMLERHGVAYEERYHADAFTAQQVAEHERFGARRVAKVVVVIADGRFVELMLPATRHVSLERVREVLNAREVRLATEAVIERHLSEADVGAAPPLRHWPAVPILMDTSMKVKGDILMQGGTHTDAVRVRFDDWFNLVHPRVESFSVRQDDAAHEHSDDKTCALCGQPHQLHGFPEELLDVLHEQAKEIERLTMHVERHTDRLLEPSGMHVLASRVNDLRARLHTETSTV